VNDSKSTTSRREYQEDAMSEKLSATVRKVTPFASVIDIEGEISSLTEQTLVAAYDQAICEGLRKIVLNFTGMSYMNSFGIGMLVTLLIRARRQNIKLVAFGLNDHYRSIFELTRINQVIPVYESEEVALAFADPLDLPEREY
jgi:anti-sigma B factor antagonist